jgi:hypothetical protein
MQGYNLYRFDQFLCSATSGSWIKGCAKAYPKPVYFILPSGSKSVHFVSSLDNDDTDMDEENSTENDPATEDLVGFIFLFFFFFSIDKPYSQ